MCLTVVCVCLQRSSSQAGCQRQSGLGGLLLKTMLPMSKSAIHSQLKQPKQPVVLQLGLCYSFKSSLAGNFTTLACLPHLSDCTLCRTCCKACAISKPLFSVQSLPSTTNLPECCNTGFLTSKFITLQSLHNSITSILSWTADKNIDAPTLLRLPAS